MQLKCQTSANVALNRSLQCLIVDESHISHGITQWRDYIGTNCAVPNLHGGGELGRGVGTLMRIGQGRSYTGDESAMSVVSEDDLRTLAFAGTQKTTTKTQLLDQWTSRSM